MNHLHEMLVEDDIIMCGLVTALGFLAGATVHVARIVWSRWVFKVR